ncbi:hypothetical protein B0H14DRAFT_2683867 [Mycena olivaceomarginata]|nr:hypothetical protein B0H14DRAFT_2683867 [Mycena olivaceomarginata]
MVCVGTSLGQFLAMFSALISAGASNVRVVSKSMLTISTPLAPTSLASVEDGGYLSRGIVVWCQLERPGIGVRVEIGRVIIGF